MCTLSAFLFICVKACFTLDFTNPGMQDFCSLLVTLFVYTNLQEVVPGSDADDGSIFEPDHPLTSKGENSTDLSGSSTPVSCHLSSVNIIPTSSLQRV